MNYDSLAVLEFAEAILHGDDEHRSWLVEAAKAFVAGEPLPPVAGSGNIDRITAERDGLLSEVECLNSNARVQAKLLADTGREREELEEALQKIESWSEAYPIDIFPEPDLKKARELLAAGGITLDAISAHCMRHVVEGVGKIARAALTPSVADADR